MQTLRDIVAALQKRYPSRADMAPITVRVALQTGVNLNNFKPEQNANPKAVQAVRDVLRDLGQTLT